MNTSSWLSLLAVCMLGAVSPGPSLAVVMKSTLQGSRNHGLVTALTHAVGIGIYAFLVAAGMAVGITQTPWLFKLITWLGAAYLAWLGYQALCSNDAFVKDVPEQYSSSLSLRQAALDGFLVSFLNPKIAVFFLALFSQFVTTETTVTTQLLMALMVTLCDGLWFCLIACIAGHSDILPALRKRAVLMSRLCGILLIFLALKILMM